MTSNRSELGICLDSDIDNSQTSLELNNLKEQVQHIIENEFPNNSSWYLEDHINVVVDLDCPSPPAQSDANTVVTSPSPYRLHMYVTNDNSKDIRFTQELFCENNGGNCLEVTTGVYLFPKDLNGQNGIEIEEYIARGFSLPFCCNGQYLDY